MAFVMWFNNIVSNKCGNCVFECAFAGKPNESSVVGIVWLQAETCDSIFFSAVRHTIVEWWNKKIYPKRWVTILRLPGLEFQFESSVLFAGHKWRIRWLCANVQNGARTLLIWLVSSSILLQPVCRLSCGCTSVTIDEIRFPTLNRIFYHSFVAPHYDTLHNK